MSNEIDMPRTHVVLIHGILGDDDLVTEVRGPMYEHEAWEYAEELMVYERDILEDIYGDAHEQALARWDIVKTETDVQLIDVKADMIQERASVRKLEKAT